MKLRPLLVLLLFVVSAGILVWIYYASTHEKPAAQNSAWIETLVDLEACSSRKHVKAAQYDHFAQIADQEGQADAASLFRAMAFSKRLHEQNCTNALIRLGGTYQAPVKIVVFRSTTNDNLARSIDYERQTLNAVHGADIRRAFNSGNRYAARVLVWSTAGDRRHLELMQAYLDRAACGHPTAVRTSGASGRRNDLHLTAIPSQGTSETDASSINSPEMSPRYLVCPVCGNIYAADQCDVYCPFCLTPSQSFIEFR